MAQAQQLAIQNNPQFTAARYNAEATYQMAPQYKATYQPTVFGSLTGVGADNGSRLAAGSLNNPIVYSRIPGRYGAIGMNVSIPILNGGLFKARQVQAELKAKAATENVNDPQNRVIRDVRVAWLSATTSYDRMALTQQLLQQASSALDLAQTRYDYGLGNIVELSTAQLNLTAAQIAVTSAHYDYQTQRILVDYQTGVLH